MYKIPKMKISMVQEGFIDSEFEKVGSTEDIAEFAANEIADSDREIVGLINVNSKGKILNWNIVSIGSLDSAFCEPRDVFKTSILSNAGGVFMVHCHPCGDATPSNADFTATERLVNAGKLLGIPLIDSVIVGCGTREFCGLRGMKPELFGDIPSEDDTVSMRK